ncbi:MAG TPA: NADH-quinone oxidoreductase subunit NuoH [Holophagaceae bacterium]|jgi:NADH-quinone oxidoreductase subunit H|nr:NADH-quinone oxidoreductase subunit NuoH [Holophagaceae bacterium]
MDTFARLLHLSPAAAWVLVKVLLAFGIPMGLGPILTWAERRGSAMMQDRIGPNRVALFGKFRIMGLLQPMADGLKFFFKEDLRPTGANKVLFWLAPAMAFVPAMLCLAVIPLGRDFQSGDALCHFSLLDPGNGMGMLLPLAVGAMAVYGVMIAAWSSNNKWSILGGMRASAQMVSYEVGLSLAVIAIFMSVGGYDPHQIVEAQAHGWFIWRQPLGFLVFFVCMFAEANRLPFDFAEGESEIVSGFHTEYGSMKFGMMGLTEYIHIIGASALIVTLYLGGWRLPFMADQSQLPVLLTFAVFLVKLVLMACVFIWVRWTLPRFRYDQLMDLGWKKLLPLSMANLLGIAYIMQMRG